jgi:hypothetical protein
LNPKNHSIELLLLAAMSFKTLYLAIGYITEKWSMPIRNWNLAMAQATFYYPLYGITLIQLIEISNIQPHFAKFGGL